MLPKAISAYQTRKKLQECCESAKTAELPKLQYCSKLPASTATTALNHTHPLHFLFQNQPGFPEVSLERTPSELSSFSQLAELKGFDFVTFIVLEVPSL